MKFVVLSDLHLGLPGQAVNGLDPAARLITAVETINRDHANADFVAIAGDLADLGAPQAYVQLHTILSGLTVPYHITLGNHDDRANYLAVFGAEQNDAEGRVSKVIDLRWSPRDPFGYNDRGQPRRRAVRRAARLACGEIRRGH